jgi:hypothetical protein
MIDGSGYWTVVLRPSAKRRAARRYVLTGADGTRLKPITITHDSNVVWSCPGCSASNFIFDTNEAPEIVNALNHAHGNSFIPKGLYTGVTVDGAGYWKITIR